MKAVVQNTTAEFFMSLGEKGDDDVVRPFDLTGHDASTPKICWKAGSTKVEKLLTDADVSIVGPEIDGKIKGVLNPSQTASFPNGEFGDIEVVVTKTVGGVTTSFQLLKSWQVIEKICD